jgi:hypothetical protein
VGGNEKVHYLARTARGLEINIPPNDTAVSQMLQFFLEDWKSMLFVLGLQPSPGPLDASSEDGLSDIRAGRPLISAIYVLGAGFQHSMTIIYISWAVRTPPSAPRASKPTTCSTSSAIVLGYQGGPNYRGVEGGLP